MSIWRQLAGWMEFKDRSLDEDFSLIPEAERDDRAEATEEDERPQQLSCSLEENRRTVEQVFSLPLNADVVIREFEIGAAVPFRAFIVFTEGLSDKTTINSYVLEPLMLLATLPPHALEGENRLLTARNKLVPSNQVQVLRQWQDVAFHILTGSTAVFLEGVDQALLVETKGWEHRTVGDTKTETVVRGPHDAFTENLRANTGLVRARLRTERLVTEMVKVGSLAPTDIAVMYMKGLTNPKLVKEVKRRIRDIKVDFLQDSGQLEQFIEDPPRGFAPKMLATERPDRVAQHLSEGYVAIFVGQSPYVLIVPTVLWSLLHTAEDAYIRFPFGSLIRLIRFGSFLTAMLLPSFYIAITNYHPEMIPTDLMLSIAQTREKVPFPVVLEVLLMEVALELIREAGIRIPNVIGPTIGIVGALILGQAAVQANIVSPLLVIVVAVTALASFTMPNYNMSFANRTLRFLFIFASVSWGFYGITLGFMVVLMFWASMKSFGVPMLSPIAPYRPSSPDVILRGSAYGQDRRPGFLWTGNMRRQKRVTLAWDPTVKADPQQGEPQEDEPQPKRQQAKPRRAKGKGGENDG